MGHIMNKEPFDIKSLSAVGLFTCLLCAVIAGQNYVGAVCILLTFGYWIHQSGKTTHLQNQIAALTEDVRLKSNVHEAQIQDQHCSIIPPASTGKESDDSSELLDSLTGLASNKGFQRLIESARCPGQSTVIAVQLDDLMTIEQHYGGLARERLIIETARILQSSLPECELLCRYSDDEFIAILSEAAAAETYDQVTIIKDEIETVIYRNFDRVYWQVGVNIGIAEQGRDGRDIEDLLSATER